MAKRVLTLDVLIAKELEYRIETGEYQEGDRLPAERKLAEYFGVQRGTVRNALQILQDKGFVISKDRSGNFVAPKRIEFNLDTYRSGRAAMERMGRPNYAKLLTFEKVYVSQKMAEKTGLPEDGQVYRIMRLRYDGSIPIWLERTYIRCDFVPDLMEEDIYNKSLYATLRKKYQIYVERCVGKVTAVYINGLESELLNLPEKQTAMRYEGMVYDQKGRLVEYFDDIMLKDKVQFAGNNV